MLHGWKGLPAQCPGMAKHLATLLQAGSNRGGEGGGQEFVFKIIEECIGMNYDICDRACENRACGHKLHPIALQVILWFIQVSNLAKLEGIYSKLNWKEFIAHLYSTPWSCTATLWLTRQCIMAPDCLYVLGEKQITHSSLADFDYQI